MTISELDATLEVYKRAIERLKASKSAIETEQVIKVLNARDDNPLLLSGLVFAGFKPRQSGGENGILSALETSTLNLLGTKLVVLSTCDTGLGRITNGEGIYNLRRALVIAGSESQIISLWKVGDKRLLPTTFRF